MGGGTRSHRRSAEAITTPGETPRHSVNLEHQGTGAKHPRLQPQVLKGTSSLAVPRREHPVESPAAAGDPDQCPGSRHRPSKSPPTPHLRKSSPEASHRHPPKHPAPRQESEQNLQDRHGPLHHRSPPRPHQHSSRWPIHRGGETRHQNHRPSERPVPPAEMGPQWRSAVVTTSKT